MYAVGLLDHLDDGTAARLVMALFERVAPGGSLVIDNLLPSNPNIAAMEVFQDWWLRHRSEDDLAMLAGAADEARLGPVQVHRDPHDALAWMELEAV